MNVGSGTGHSLVQLIDVVRSTTGIDPVVQFGPPRSFDVRSIVLDVSRLASLVDWRPTTLEEGVAMIWERSERRWEAVGP